MSHQIAVAFFSVLLVAHVSSNSAQPARQDSYRPDCELRDKDSTFLAGGPVYRDCAVEKKANLLTNVHPDYHPTSMRTGCMSAELEFVVDDRGMVEVKTARVSKTNNQELADAVLAVLQQFRYEPAMLGGVAVRQIVLFKEAAVTAVTSNGRAPSKAAGQIPRC